jgi:ribonuclease P protein component
MRFRPEQHIRRQSDFRLIREQGRRIHGGLFTLWWLPRENASNGLRRVGVVASIKAVGNAILRNRAKRRLRELFRRHQEILPAGCDFLLVARRDLNQKPFSVAEEHFLSLATKLRSARHA